MVDRSSLTIHNRLRCLRRGRLGGAARRSWAGGVSVRFVSSLGGYGWVMVGMGAGQLALM